MKKSSSLTDRFLSAAQTLLRNITGRKDNDGQVEYIDLDYIDECTGYPGLLSNLCLRAPHNVTYGIDEYDAEENIMTSYPMAFRIDCTPDRAHMSFYHGYAGHMSGTKLSLQRIDGNGYRITGYQTLIDGCVNQNLPRTEEDIGDFLSGITFALNQNRQQHPMRLVINGPGD